MTDSQSEAYLRELQKLRETYLQEVAGEIRTHFARRDRKPPEEFHDSSFLYMRTYHADIGVRPILLRIAHWRSPDITLSPVTSMGTYTTQLQAGETYVVRCLLRNRGDLAVPSAKVELFLTDPSLGFDTRFATNLTLGNVPTAWVGANANAAAEFLYTVPPTESGHKCLFARAFSFSPLELPVDDFQLDPRIDRHVAQQNLNIVGQAQAYSFAMVHAPNARMRVNLRVLQPEEVLALRHPLLAEVAPAPEFPQRGWARLTRLKLEEAGSKGVDLREDGEGLTLAFSDRDGLSLDAQKELNVAVWDVIRAVNEGRTRMAAHRELLAQFREMNSQARRSKFGIVLPKLGLKADQVVGLDITAIDENRQPPEVIGGITLLIVGE